jgi:hypothetical protein
LRWFAAIAATGLLLVTVLNLAIDPNGAYPTLSLKALSPYRQQLVTRPAKAEMLRRTPCEVLLLGSSRVQVGLPVRAAVYGTNRVCNLGLSGTTLPELAIVLEYALRHQRPQRVLLGTDFFMFSDTRKSTVGFESSRFDPELRVFDYHLKNALGAQATDDSWRLLRQWMRKERPLAVDRGFLPKSLRANTSQRDTFARCIRKFVTEPETYGAYHYSRERLELIRQMIRHCRGAGVDLVIFIPPVHALELETIRAAGLWDTFEAWKRDLGRIAAEENTGSTGPSASSGQATVPIWDFTGFTGPVIEEVPPSGDRRTRMRYYLENSHFTPALGEQLLNRMLVGVPGETAETWGARITTSAIDEHLARLRREREAYATSHAHEVAWVEQLTHDKTGKVSGGEDL